MKRLIGIMISLAIIIIFPCTSHAYTVRIGLQTRVSSANIGSQHEAVIWESNYRTPIVKIHAMEQYTAIANSGRIIIKKPDCSKTFDTKKSEIVILPRKNDGLVFNKKTWYRGHLKLKARGNYITVINVIDLEDYIKGVVPAEMPASWNIEALKAQAIAARSYVLANINKRSSEGYDLVDTPLDQAYKGASHENSRSNYAVDLTRAQVIANKDNIVPAYYHASSGGQTDSEGWSGKIGFAKAVRDFDEPGAGWTKSYTAQSFSNAVSSAGYSIGTIREVTITDRTEGGRVKQLKLTGSGGSKTISGEKFAGIFNLKSKLFTVYPEGNSVIIYGRGNGHGIGMSQWGAKALADRGCNVYQILSYYYANVQIRKIDERYERG